MRPASTLRLPTRADPPLPLARLRVRDELTRAAGSRSPLHERPGRPFSHAGLGPESRSRRCVSAPAAHGRLGRRATARRPFVARHPDPPLHHGVRRRRPPHRRLPGSEVIDGLRIIAAVPSPHVDSRSLSAPLCAAVSDDADAGARPRSSSVPTSFSSRSTQPRCIAITISSASCCAAAREETPDMVELLNLRASAWHRSQGLAEERSATPSRQATRRERRSSSPSTGTASSHAAA